MKAQTIDAAALASLAGAGQEFSVSAQAQDDGWIIYVHDQQGDRALLDLEGKAAAVFDALEAVEQRLQALGIAQFEIYRRQRDEDYDAWLKGQVQEALDDPSPPIPHEEAIRMILAAIRTDK